ncbi:Basic 7S globulin 2 [Dichanthelium oligosanthes]|uniref:Basic 7S globulin 2 n=1 Tax=Dichanthelium oligosanthes TaxID=888268 RepID=A0A1E5W353_9POAL|nr:Basic 7S globulin 2 [Dichanthelium oligosanthes]
MSAQAKFVTNASMVSSLLAALLLLPCTAAASQCPPYQPLVAPINLDVSTSLHSVVIKNGSGGLVLDLAGSLVWSTCPGKHGTVPCDSAACRQANRQHPRRCRYVDAGWFGAGREPGWWGCACAAHPSNPLTGECSTGDLTSFSMSAKATDGRNALDYPVEQLPAVVASCAPDRLLGSLPALATGVAGFSRSPLSLPSQLASRRAALGNKFALCLPGGGYFLGFAMFGNTSVSLGRHLPELTSTIPYFPLARNPRNGAYYLPVKTISVRGQQTVDVGLPAGALDIDVNEGRGGVALSTVTRHMTMRPDVYRAFLQAYDTAVQRNGYAVKRVAAVPPFELCYEEASLRPRKRFGYDVPVISLELTGAAQAWTVANVNLLQFIGGPACVAVVEMGRDTTAGAAEDDKPAVVLGLDQLEEHLLVFDLDKGVLGFSDPLVYMDTTCTDFYYPTH